MFNRRISSLLEDYRIPQPSAPALTPGGFMVCPLALVQGQPPAQQSWQSALYQLAFEQAQAALHPSLPERDLLAVWN
jgi:hypothetical protein